MILKQVDQQHIFQKDQAARCFHRKHCHTHRFNDSNLKLRPDCAKKTLYRSEHHGMAEARPTDASATYYSGPLQLIQIDEVHGMGMARERSTCVSCVDHGWFLLIGNHRGLNSKLDQLVSSNSLDYKDGKCHLQENAVAILNQIPGRLAVVGIAGLYRTGKSFLLNRLLGLQDGFEIGPSVNPCTKGLWIWGQPVQLAADYHCILIDTEGLGSTQRSASCDMQILSLCILLSSYFIYNSMGAIDEQVAWKDLGKNHQGEKIKDPEVAP